MTLRPLAIAALAGALALAGCGKYGKLDRPGPLFANERSTTKAADEATHQMQDPARPVDTVDPRDRSMDPAPPRSLPIEGQAPNPSEMAPPGALPNPYANPSR
jgi:hypothetical protein